MGKNLVIVESPAKAKTIENFLGKDFIVKSSMGHVRDLAKSKTTKDSSGIGIDIKNGFKPIYEVLEDKKTIITELKKLAKESEIVWLATDEDREGEAISWHLLETLKINENKTKRIVFHEITKSAILNAIENPRTIDKNLVNAQQARRVLDRLVGFELSPLLWKKVKPSLSAGRVQSVAVRLIVERETEIKDFKIVSSYKITANFDIEKNGQTSVLKAELPNRFQTKEEAINFLKKCLGADFIVDSIETKPAKKSPAPPFTTSTLQQEASRKLGFSVGKTMMIAQQLYESGKITYMRTDSVNLSDMALSTIKDEVISLYGEQYVKIRKYTTKTKGAQEAHEAIRPSYINNQNISGDDAQRRLYDLIWKRTIASQMSDAELEKTNVTIKISTTPEKFIARGEVLKFDGFLKVYMESTDDEEDEAQKDMLPPIKVGELLKLKDILAIEKFSQTPPRYTEASLVKKLEELGIGRPSTYAPTISTIQKRGYVVIEDRPGTTRNYTYISLSKEKISEEIKTEVFGTEKSKIFPTDIGSLVNRFLLQYFDNIIDYNFTASVEKEFDEIAQGMKEWEKVINDFYFPFHKQIEQTNKNSEKVSGEKFLGKDPETGKPVYVKIGKFGPIVQMGETESEEKPRFAGLLKGQSIETITFEEALELFKLPKVIGTFEGTDIIVSVSRFGPYIKHMNGFYSLKKTDNPTTINESRAIEIILEKRTKDSNKLIKEFTENPEVKVLRGRWGIYIAIGKNNYKIPKGTEPEKLSLKDCLEIAETQNKETPVKGKVKSKKQK
ncbi:MAG TPA: type I DNA topoisomerase [Bacteroidales bacterium]|nr:type I DNA topoisomerase [Bacteroidales bacterium]HPS16016.1 type I DNA topoisomerase [Bacteroidales bacterium]